MFQHPEDRLHVMDFVRKMPNDNFVTSNLDKMCGKSTCGMGVVCVMRKYQKTFLKFPPEVICARVRSKSNATL